MFTKDLRLVTHIHGSPETIFDLVADMPTYGSKKNSFVLLEAWLESQWPTADTEAGRSPRPTSYI